MNLSLVGLVRNLTSVRLCVIDQFTYNIEQNLLIKRKIYWKFYVGVGQWELLMQSGTRDSVKCPLFSELALNGIRGQSHRQLNIIIYHDRHRANTTDIAKHYVGFYD